jgi:uncharacterized membrane protein
MSTVIKSVDVDVPVSTAFAEWTRFEELPRFMRGVVEVRPIDDRHLHWRGHIAGVETVWRLEITELGQNELIAWCSESGPKNRGAIEFEPLPLSRTRVTMEVRYDPASFVQNVTDYLGVLDRWVERSLARFREVMEEKYTLPSPLPRAEELVGQ